MAFMIPFQDSRDGYRVKTRIKRALKPNSIGSEWFAVDYTTIVACIRESLGRRKVTTVC